MADDGAPLASLSLTHVYYDPSDPVSYACAWLALVPQALCVVYVTLLWSSREAEVALLFAGQLACEALNFALKRLIKEERPRRIHGKGYGMPSSHAQFVAFWALSLALFLLVRHRPRAATVGHGKSGEKDKEKEKKEDEGEGTKKNDNNRVKSKSAGHKSSNKPAVQDAPPPPVWDLWRLQEMYGVDRYPHRPWSMPERAAISTVAFVLAGLVAWSRVYLGYHTSKQVMVGTLAGLASALGWFAATETARRLGLVAWLLALPAARWFRLRDLVVEEDICQAGWEKWEQRRLAAAVAADASAISPSKKIE